MLQTKVVDRFIKLNRRRADYRVFGPIANILREGASRIKPFSEPILIYTAEKVGTQTILSTLKSVSIRQRVYMTHTVVGSNSSQATRSMKLDLEKLRNEIYPNRMRVITSIREPIGRDVSLFFELLPSLDLDRRQVSSIEGLTEAFLAFVGNQLCKSYLTIGEWFNDEFYPAIGVDVNIEVQAPGPGVRIIEGDDTTVYLLRLEDFGGELAPLLAKLTGLDRMEISDFNRASQKEADTLRSHYLFYSEFVQRAQLPEDYIEKVLSEKLILKMYTSSEIAKLRGLWLRKAML